MAKNGSERGMKKKHEAQSGDFKKDHSVEMRCKKGPRRSFGFLEVSENWSP